MQHGSNRRSGAHTKSGLSPTEVIARIDSPPSGGPARRSPSQTIAEVSEVGYPQYQHDAEQPADGPRSAPPGSPQVPATAAFWSVWAQHRDFLKRHTLRWMSNHPADAEDALSSAMLLAQRKYQQYAPAITNERAWLARLVYNVCMDAHRSKSRIACFDSLPDDEEIVGHGSYAHLLATTRPDQEALERETMTLLRQALDRLSPALREPLVLRCLHELSYAEIAQRLDLTECAVRKRVQLARDKLRDLLGEG